MKFKSGFIMLAITSVRMLPPGGGGGGGGSTPAFNEWGYLFGPIIEL
jgi:hypothetical protein